MQRSNLVTGAGEALSKPGYKADDWMIATVPGTALTSYLNDGAIADPDFGDNQYAVSDSFFCADFWYRDEFVAPALAPGHHLWLNFDGINWKAEVYLNGQHLGRIDGGMHARPFRRHQPHPSRCAERSRRPRDRKRQPWQHER